MPITKRHFIQPFLEDFEELELNEQYPFFLTSLWEDETDTMEEAVQLPPSTKRISFIQKLNMFIKSKIENLRF